MGPWLMADEHSAREAGALAASRGARLGKVGEEAAEHYAGGVDFAGEGVAEVRAQPGVGGGEGRGMGSGGEGEGLPGLEEAGGRGVYRGVTGIYA